MSTSATPAEFQVVGQVVAFETDAGEEVRGNVFAYDALQGMFVIEEKAEHTVLKSNFRIFNETCIKAGSMKVLRAAPAAAAKASLPRLSADRMLERERQALRKVQEGRARVGVGVTADGQDTFDCLCKMFKCEWRASGSFFIPDLHVTVSAPYEAANCSGGNAASLGRVRMMVSEIKKKQDRRRRSSADKATTSN